jgi:hypothetical protein
MVLHEVGPLVDLGGWWQLLQRLRQRRRLTADDRQEQPLVDDEIEEHVHLVAVLVAEEAALVGRGHVGLGQQDRVAAPPVQEGPQVAEELVRVAELLALDTGLLDEERGRVQPEAGQAQLEPEPDHLVDLVAHLGIGDVQVRHALVEPVQVVLSGALVEFPVGGLLAREDDVLGTVGGRLVDPAVEVAVRRGAVGARGLEPRVVD